MPHTVLEFSHCPILSGQDLSGQGLSGPNFSGDLSAFFLELHAALAETKIVELERLKGRALEHKSSVVGAHTDGSFIFLQISLLEGRTISQRTALVDVAERVLSKWISIWKVPHHCSVTVEVREMTLATHRKIQADIAR